MNETRMQRTVLSAPAPGAVTNIGHRGAAAAAPENTLASAELAIAHGAQCLELDVQRTLDGELVVIHDPTLTRTTDARLRYPHGAPWHVGMFTLDELRELDAGAWFDRSYAGQRVPTLAEWIDVIDDRADLLVEFKLPGLYPGVEHDLVRLVACHEGFAEALAEGRAVIQSFDHNWVRACRDLMPFLSYGLLFDRPPTAAELDEAATWATQINLQLPLVGPALVKAIHARGLQANVWTVNRADDLARMIACGVDGIVTDRPQALHDVCFPNGRAVVASR